MSLQVARFVLVVFLFALATPLFASTARADDQGRGIYVGADVRALGART